MELRQLEHFVAMAEERNFTRAARRVHIVQSGLSASIRALETELDIELFTRSTRRVEMTAAGNLLYQRAQLILAAIKEARADIKALHGLQRGRIMIGTMQGLDTFIDLTALLERFHKEYPNIEIHLSQTVANDLPEHLKAGRMDLGFLPLFKPIEGMTTQPIASDAMVLVCSGHHPLAARRHVSLEGLKQESFVAFSINWATRRIVDRMFARAGIEREVAFEVNDLKTMVELVARGLGIGILPETVAKRLRESMPRPPIAIVYLQQPDTWDLVVAYIDQGHGHGPSNPAARVFLDLIVEQLAAGAD